MSLTTGTHAQSIPTRFPSLQRETLHIELNAITLKSLVRLVTDPDLEVSVYAHSSIDRLQRKPPNLDSVLMTILSLGLLALGASAASAAVLVDDTVCAWNWSLSSLGCQPSALCVYNFNFGDLTLSQSCRVKDGVNFYPQQIHLAFAGTTAGTGMTVSWATFEEVDDSSLWVGTSEASLALVDTAVKSVDYYRDDEYEMYHHHATVSSLSPHTKYFYKVGSRTRTTYQSDVNSFVTARSASHTSTFKVLIYGDAGDGDNSEDTLTYANTLTSNDIDLVYHIGDIAYADDDYLVASQVSGFFYEEVYNKWMNSLAPVMSVIPYMVVVGNHEAECHSPACQLSRAKKNMLGNYTAYNSRFKMPYEESGGALNMWHSFDHGPLHFTSLSSETDYPNAPSNEYTLTHKNGNFGDQLKWIESDLAKADANRGNVPWIIVGMHRPLYDVDGCDDAGVPTDQNANVQSAFEALFIKYKVDVVLTAHKHYYERQLPIANNAAVMDGVSNDFKTYDNPQAPVYILTGAAGNIENLTDAPAGTAPWNAAVDYTHFGFSVLEANRSMLSWKYVSASDKSVTDEFVMNKRAK
ncbi:Iron/zinc purple acid phosphatase-like protein C [Phytophthora infestans]|uniref:Purple acid phosphatase n=1 Tax=Phytophthora infestans TaxID=4787 RepID=A0A833VYW8_PHYIN|nr:Iron/zinc purple acid phosphatase-like protein C [Phytophthora infestans]